MLIKVFLFGSVFSGAGPINETSGLGSPCVFYDLYLDTKSIPQVVT